MTDLEILINQVVPTKSDNYPERQKNEQAVKRVLDALKLLEARVAALENP